MVNEDRISPFFHVNNLMLLPAWYVNDPILLFYFPYLILELFNIFMYLLSSSPLL